MGINSSFCSFRACVFSNFLFLISIANSGSASAQTISSGTIVKVKTGQVAVSKGNFKINAGAVLKNEGKLILKKNLVNKNPLPNYLGQGKIIFSGNTVQTISGQNVFQDLVINNPAGVVLAGNTSVLGTLTLQNGVLILENNNLTLGPSAVIAGTPSSAAMVVTNGTGEFRKEFSATGTFTFPVGDLTGNPDYSPVTLNLVSGVFGSGSYISLHATGEKYPGVMNNDNFLKRYWKINSKNITNLSCNTLFQYNSGDIMGQESKIYCIRADATPWMVYGPADPATHTLSANDIPEGGIFTGAGMANSTPMVRAYLESLYSGNGIMRKSQDENGDHFPGNIADMVTVELHDKDNYQLVIYNAGLVNILVTGEIMLGPIPSSINGSFYLTVKHRNSIETVSAQPVSVSAGSILYDFTTGAAKAYGNNLKEIDGRWVVFGGDVNQDDIVDAGDRNLVENAISLMTMGYVPEDVNGDGFVDASDLNIIDNNATALVMAVTP